MDRAALATALATGLPQPLADDLADQFIEIRRDVATGTLGRASPGKFVESLVQALQHLETGKHDEQPKVDEYLRTVESRAGLPDGLRICAARVGRAMYAIRSKRTIVHKGAVDPNTYDLRFLYAGAQWVLAEMLAQMQGLSMAEAGRLIEQVQMPVGSLVEAFDGQIVVHARGISIRDELLLTLFNLHPTRTTSAELCRHLDRRGAGSVRNALSVLWKAKYVHRRDDGYTLSEEGLREAVAIASGLV